MNIVRELELQNDFKSIKNVLESRNLTVKEWSDRFLVCYPYQNTEETVVGESKSVVDFNDPVCGESKGIIFQKTPLKLVCYSMDRFEQPSEDNVAWVRDNWDKVIVEENVDGSLIKLYFHNDKWCISTNRCIEARRAKWNNYRSFYDFVEEAMKAVNLTSTSNLDVGCVYTFVLCHPENRIVVNYSTPSLVHVATRRLSDLCEIDVDIEVPKPFVDENFKSFEDFQSFMNLSDPAVTTGDDSSIDTGYVLKYKRNDDDNSYSRMKFESENYKNIRDLKGNVQDPVLRYLWLQRNDPNKFAEFKKYYPEFGWVESQMQMLVSDIHRSYIEHFINKNQQFIPNRDYWQMLSELHTNYYRTREKTTRAKVRQHLSAYPIEKVSRLLRME